MSITDELREWWVRKFPIMDKELHKDFTAIADRIDAEHERECKEQYACGAEHGIGASIDASMIQTHGYIELPKDADDVPWNVGDRDEDGNTVIELRLTASGWYVLTDGERVYRPDRHRHHHAPIVEDVLREFALKVAGKECMTMRSDVVDEYAAKLRLVEGEDA